MGARCTNRDVIERSMRDLPSETARDVYAEVVRIHDESVHPSDAPFLSRFFDLTDDRIRDRILTDLVRMGSFMDRLSDAMHMGPEMRTVAWKAERNAIDEAAAEAVSRAEREEEKRRRMVRDSSEQASVTLPRPVNNVQSFKQAHGKEDRSDQEIGTKETKGSDRASQDREGTECRLRVRQETTQANKQQTPFPLRMETEVRKEEGKMRMPPLSFRERARKVAKACTKSIRRRFRGGNA